MTLVALRTCPSCGGVLLGFAGVAWMVCRDCPTAWDLFAQPAVSLPTRRPSGKDLEAQVWLPFYVFDAHRAESGAFVWVPAYRESGTWSDQDIGSVLTSRPYLVDLVETPLRTPVARGLTEATALFDVRRGRSHTGPVRCEGLVSLPCRVRGDVLEEPVSGLSLKRANILPRVRD